MTLFITYQELQQFAADKFHLNVELNTLCGNIVELTLPCIINEYGDMHILITVMLDLSVCGEDISVDYKRVMPTNNMQNGLLSDFLDSYTFNVFNPFDYSLNECYTYTEIIEKMPDEDRLLIHLAAVPQLQTILQDVEIESIVPEIGGLQIVAHMKDN